MKENIHFIVLRQVKVLNRMHIRNFLAKKAFKYYESLLNPKLEASKFHI